MLESSAGPFGAAGPNTQRRPPFAGGSELSSTMPESDAEVLLRVARGDAAAFPACIDCFGPLVWTLARQVLANRSDAEEAVQEAFAEIWRVAARFDPSIASARSFVATIARRRLIDRGRLRQRFDRDSGGQLSETAPAKSADPADAIAQDEFGRTAMEEFERLRPEQQKVIRLSVHAGWTHERIAEHLGMPVGTVKTHLRRGLLELRDALQQRDLPGRDSAQEAAP